MSENDPTLGRGNGRGGAAPARGRWATDKRDLGAVVDEAKAALARLARSPKREHAELYDELVGDLFDCCRRVVEQGSVTAGARRARAKRVDIAAAADNAEDERGAS